VLLLLRLAREVADHRAPTTATTEARSAKAHRTAAALSSATDPLPAGNARWPRVELDPGGPAHEPNPPHMFAGPSEGEQISEGRLDRGVAVARYRRTPHHGDGSTARYQPCLSRGFAGKGEPGVSPPSRDHGRHIDGPSVQLTALGEPMARAPHQVDPVRTQAWDGGRVDRPVTGRLIVVQPAVARRYGDAGPAVPGKYGRSPNERKLAGPRGRVA